MIAQLPANVNDFFDLFSNFFSAGKFSTSAAQIVENFVAYTRP